MKLLIASLVSSSVGAGVFAFWPRRAKRHTKRALGFRVHTALEAYDVAGNRWRYPGGEAL